MSNCESMYCLLSKGLMGACYSLMINMIFLHGRMLVLAPKTWIHGSQRHELHVVLYLNKIAFSSSHTQPTTSLSSSLFSLIRIHWEPNKRYILKPAFSMTHKRLGKPKDEPCCIFVPLFSQGLGQNWPLLFLISEKLLHSPFQTPAFMLVIHKTAYLKINS